MNIVHWQVNFQSLPKIKKYCKKCGGNNTFASSESFRVNAQKKILDIWLIYKCEACDSTWNLAIYSRIPRQKLAEDLLNRFMVNDSDLIKACASDISILKHNGVEIIMPDFEIIGGEIDQSSKTKLSISSSCRAGIGIVDILSQKMNTSKSNIKNLIKHGLIFSDQSEDIAKHKIVSEFEMYICLGD